MTYDAALYAKDPPFYDPIIFTLAISLDIYIYIHTHIYRGGGQKGSFNSIAAMRGITRGVPLSRVIETRNKSAEFIRYSLRILLRELFGRLPCRGP